MLLLLFSTRFLHSSSSHAIFRKTGTSPLMFSTDFLDWCNGLSATVVSHDSIVQIHCGVWANVNGAVSGGRAMFCLKKQLAATREGQWIVWEIWPWTDDNGSEWRCFHYLYVIFKLSNPCALVCEFACIKMWVIINKPDRKSALWRKTLSEIVYLNINDHHGIKLTICEKSFDSSASSRISDDACIIDRQERME